MEEVFLDGGPGTCRTPLPSALLAALDRVASDATPALLVHGVRVSPDLEPTPTNWRSAHGRSPEHDELLMAVAAHLGELFAWPTLQDGAAVQNVVPMRGHEQLQSGHGSEAPLAWHTEDAFVADPPDYIALLCLRNPHGVRTTVATLQNVCLDEGTWAALSSPRFRIAPDPVHLNTHPDAASRLGLDRPPPPLPIIRVRGGRTEFRLDHWFTEVAESDGAARRALHEVRRVVEGRLLAIALEPGDLLLLDNARTVHGREAFQAAFDGSDRWLKKVLAYRRSET